MAQSAAAMTGRSKGRIFYGWWMVAAACGLQFMQAGLLQQSFGAYVAVLRDELGWSKTALSGGAVIQQVESVLLGPVQGWFIDRFGPRGMICIGVVLFDDGYAWLEQGNAHDWSGGCLEDFSGNDTYRSSGASQGCGFFVSFAYLLDSHGDDRYYIKQTDTTNSQGGGNFIQPRHSGSLGLLMDLGKGDDWYLDPRRTAAREEFRLTATT